VIGFAANAGSDTAVKIARMIPKLRMKTYLRKR
jgi:hypothetical protein